MKQKEALILKNAIKQGNKSNLEEKRKAKKLERRNTSLEKHLEMLSELYSELKSALYESEKERSRLSQELIILKSELEWIKGK